MTQRRSRLSCKPGLSDAESLLTFVNKSNLLILVLTRTNNRLTFLVHLVSVSETTPCHDILRILYPRNSLRANTSLKVYFGVATSYPPTTQEVLIRLPCRLLLSHLHEIDRGNRLRTPLPFHKPATLERVSVVDRVLSYLDWVSKSPLLCPFLMVDIILNKHKQRR